MANWARNRRYQIIAINGLALLFENQPIVSYGNLNEPIAFRIIINHNITTLLSKPL